MYFNKNLFFFFKSPQKSLQGVVAQIDQIDLSITLSCYYAFPNKYLYELNFPDYLIKNLRKKSRDAYFGIDIHDHRGSMHVHKKIYLLHKKANRDHENLCRPN